MIHLRSGLENVYTFYKSNDILQITSKGKFQTAANVLESLILSMDSICISICVHSDMIYGKNMNISFLFEQANINTKFAK